MSDVSPTSDLIMLIMQILANDFYNGKINYMNLCFFLCRCLIYKKNIIVAITLATATTCTSAFRTVLLPLPLSFTVSHFVPKTIIIYYKLTLDWV